MSFATHTPLPNQPKSRLGSLPRSLEGDLAGLGLRFPYHQEILDTKPDLGWLEIHPENYFGGGEPLYFLEKIREHYPLSFHSVGLSLGSTERVSPNHMKQIKALIDRFEPFQVSDHASWSANGNAHLNDLLPLPYTQEGIETIVRNINDVQEIFGREILIENPSASLSFKEDEMLEPEFLNEVAQRTGCYLLLDVNNAYVQSVNHDFDPKHYIDTIRTDRIREIHLAGHTVETDGEHRLLIDTHNDTVCNDVWELYEYTIQKHGTHLTLIEWDQDYPDLDILMSEVKKVRNVISRVKDVAA